MSHVIVSFKLFSDKNQYQAAKFNDCKDYITNARNVSIHLAMSLESSWLAIVFQFGCVESGLFDVLPGIHVDFDFFVFWLGIPKCPGFQGFRGFRDSWE
eukprot:1371769-Amorphochlora_amoeboformis.AAC.1